MDEYTTSARAKQGFMAPAVMIDLLGDKNTILDPYSVLISEGVVVGAGNVFYPNVVIARRNDAAVTIGDNNVFYPGVYVIASAGAIRMGDANEFGPAGCTIKANVPDANIVIGNSGRYCDGVSIMGNTTLGDGSQVLGAITLQGCALAAGGTFQEPDPDKRAAVLKGFGLARNISLEMGQVVNGAGNFADSPVEQQRAYHPKP